MAISFDRAFGIHQHALAVREQRAEVLTSNIANADTPGYKARDLNFAAALERAQQRQGFAISRSDERHLVASSSVSSEVGYRVPDQPDTGDGNSVDVHQERSRFVENAMEYEATMRFLNGKIRGLTSAIKGE